MQAKKLASGMILRGEYVLLGLIGDTNSNVFRAHHRKDNRLVAVRIVQLDPAEAHARTLDLAAKALTLRDPMIAAVEASGTTKDGLWFIVSEYVAGQRLDQWADKVGIPPLAMVIELMQKLARALQLSHAQGLAHGAVNPRNLVLLRSEGADSPSLSTKLLDLGVPTFMRQRPPRLRSAYYMAPEQLAGLLRADGGRALEADPRMDIYGCGCLLYYLCTGGSPFHGRSLGELITSHAAEKLLPPSRINPRIPAGLEAVIVRALANDPEERFASGDELAEALELVKRVSSNSGVILRAPAPPPRESVVPAAPALDAIFSESDFDEKPTAEVPGLDASSLAETVPPPSLEAAEIELEAVLAAPAPRVATPPPLPQVTDIGPPRSAGAMPLTDIGLPRNAGAMPSNEASVERTSSPGVVPAGSFSSAPPVARLSDPFRPAGMRAQRSPLEIPVVNADAMPLSEPLDTLPDAMQLSLVDRMRARLGPVDRRLIAGGALVLTLAAVAYLVMRPTAPAELVQRSSVSAIEAEGPAHEPRLQVEPAPAQSGSARRVQAPPPYAITPRAHEWRAPARTAAAAKSAPGKTGKSASPPAPTVAPAPAGAAEPARSPEPEPQTETQREEPRTLAAQPRNAGAVLPNESPALDRAPETETQAERVAPVLEPSTPAASSARREAPAAAATAAAKAPAPARPLGAATQIRELSVRGALSTAAVRRAIERTQSEFEQCYLAAARAAGRNSFGELAVEVTIGENGRAEKPEARGSALPGLNGCVAQAAGRLVSARRPDTGKARAIFSVAFVPK